MTGSERRRIEKAKREANGLCVYCGKKEPTTNRKGCKSCLEYKVKQTLKRCQTSGYSREKAFSFKRKIDVITKYGGKCVCCGESDVVFLSIDHINNNGNEERKKMFGRNTGSPGVWYKMLNKSGIRDDLQVLCYNCNHAKHLYGECPHQNRSGVPDVSILLVDKRHTTGRNIKIDWPDNETLFKMVSDSDVAKVARALKVHYTTLKSRLERQKYYETQETNPT